MSLIVQDLRYAFRTLIKSPAFALIAVVTLALGIGANTAVFSVVNAVLLRPLPYENPDRLTLVWTEFGPDLPQNWVSGPELVEMQEMNTLFDGIGAVVPFTTAVSGGGEPEEVGAAGASGNFLQLLGVRAARGRLFGPDDDRPGAPRIAVLSHGFWTRRFGADPGVIGSTIVAGGQATTIIGVLPPEFSIQHPDAQFSEQVALWFPMGPLLEGVFGAGAYRELPRGAHFIRAFGRMKPGVTLAQAQADMDAVALAMQEQSPDYYDFAGWGITVMSLHGDLVEDVRPALFVILGAVGFVLLIACVNVANLLLARAAGREREIAVRTALGAGRWRLVRQLLTESLVLAASGGAVGLAAAFALVRAITVFAPDALPRTGDIGIDGGVLLFTVAISLATGTLFGLAPAFHTLKGNLAESFKEGGKGATVSLRGRRMRTALVVAEVALALVLLVGAGLMIKSFARLLESDPGYRTDDILTMRISLPSTRYSGSDVVQFYDALLTRVRALPGVTAAGTISQLPLSGSYQSGTTAAERSETLAPDQRAFEADRRFVSPDYFATMGVALLAGRTFTERDNADAPLVAMVDETFVRRVWPNEDPIGQRVSVGSRVWREVVGVVRHSRHYALGSNGREQVYLPYAQMPANTMYLAVRTATDPLALASTVGGEVWAIDRDQPVSDIQTMEMRVAGAVAQPRFNLLLLAAFATVALFLAAVGIYGVISYSVAQRGHEIGVRMALGARGGDVVTLVMRQGLALVGVGLGIGTVAALGLTRLLTSLLYGVGTADPLTYAAVAALLGGAGAAACYLPARRATLVEPVEVLREE